MSDDAHVIDLLPAYTLASLDAEEAGRVEEHLLSCWICRNEFDAFQTAADQLSLLAPVADPSPDLKEQLMQRVQAARSPVRLPVQAAKSSWFERLLPAWGLASLGLIVLLAAFNVFLWQRLNQGDVLMAPGGMRAVPLHAPVVGSAATGFVLISANGDDGALVVDGLPKLDESHEYQLWLIQNGEKTSGAVFSTDAKEYGGTRIRAPRSLLDYSAVEITIEPAGGSSEPTGEDVLGGPLVKR